MKEESIYNNLENLIEFLHDNSIRFKENYDLSQISWMRAGGVAFLFIEPATVEEIKLTVKFLKKINEDYGS